MTVENLEVSEIYSKEHELKIQHQGYQARVSTLYIIIKEEIFVYRSFDKKHQSPFSMVLMPQNIFYAAMLGLFLTIGRSRRCFNGFIPESRS